MMESKHARTIACAISTKNLPSQGEPLWLKGWFQSPGVKLVNQPR